MEQQNKGIGSVEQRQTLDLELQNSLKRSRGSSRKNEYWTRGGIGIVVESCVQ